MDIWYNIVRLVGFTIRLVDFMIRLVEFIIRLVEFMIYLIEFIKHSPIYSAQYIIRLAIVFVLFFRLAVVWGPREWQDRTSIQKNNDNNKKK